MLLVIPAIDIKNGKCVRLQQGKFEEETVYFSDPVKTAQLWRIENAKLLHVVDLDGALNGIKENLTTIEAIIKGVDIPVQVGGGIRSIEDVRQYLGMGVCRVIIGTAAVKNPDFVKQSLDEFGPKKIMVGIDALNGKVAIKGWTEDSGLDAVEFGKKMKGLGLERIIVTDISRDGMLQGMNLDFIKEMAVQTKLRVTASGGVSGYHDLIELKDLVPFGVDSVIIGKALYENKFACQALWRVNEKNLNVEQEIKRFTEHDFKKKCGHN